MKNIVVNTLVFAKQHAQGMSQFDMVQQLNEAGFNKIEIRREYFKNIKEETAVIGEYANTHTLTLFYSVPLPLYDQHKLDKSSIRGYFQEASQMKASSVKLVIGDDHLVEAEDVSFLNELQQTFNISLTVENDQTTENGTGDKIYNFVTEFNRKGGKIGVTFDAGNWIWVKEDPIENAKKLAPFVTYLHLKDVSGWENPTPVFLNEGIIDWQEIRNLLNKDIPVALEYPMGEYVLEVLQQEYETFNR